MTNVKFSRAEFEKEIPITKEIEEKISLFGTPLESISSEELEVEIFPNRPDLISLQGYLRGFKAFLGMETGLRNYEVKKPKKNFKVVVDKSVEKVRPYTVCAIVKSLDFDDEKIKNIIDLQEKLHSTVGRNRKKVAIGIYPLDKITLPISYEARKPKNIVFQPLEYEKKIDGLEILKKHPTGKEFAHLLEDKEEFPVFVDAEKNILSMPPIINSHETGRVSVETKDVFVECSGGHLETLKKTLNVIVTTLADIGGEIYSMDVRYPDKKIVTPDLSSEKINISLNNANKLLGLELTEKDLRELLPRMGYEYKKSILEVPAWRFDILHEVDVIEDIAISYGYNNLEPKEGEIATQGEESEGSKLKRKISEILTGLGISEISTYHLVKKDEISKLKNYEKIEIEESKTEYKYLRQGLLVPALRIAAENKDKSYPQKYFEIGSVFSRDAEDKTETGIVENENLSVTCTPSNFTEAKQVLDYLTRLLSLDYELKEISKEGLIDGRTGEIIIDGKAVGFLGEVHPETLKFWGIKMPVSYFEISLDKIFNL